MMKGFDIFLATTLSIWASCSGLSIADTVGSLTWEKALANFKEAGGSFNYEDYPLPPVPDKENFGAIEALRGMAIPDHAEHPSGLDGAKVRDKLPHSFYAEGLDEAELPGFGTAMHRFDPKLGAWESYLTGRPTVSSQRESAGKILEVLSARFGEIFAQTDAAIDRPHSHLTPPPSDFFDVKKSAEFQTNYCSRLIALSQLFTLRNSAAIHTGDSETAKHSLLTQLHLLRMAQNARTGIIEQLVAITQFRFLQAGIWEGLQNRVFGEPTLERLQNQVQSLDLVSTYVRAMQLEAFSHFSYVRNFALHSTGDELEELLPQLKGEAVTAASFDQIGAYYIDAMTRAIIQPLAIRDYAAYETRTKLVREKAAEHKDDPRYALLNFNISLWFDGPSLGLSAHEAHLRLTVTAIALERYFLRHERYPGSLDSLKPEFLKEVPLDPNDHKPIRYAPTNDGRYLLYCVGPDFKDNGGKPAPNDDPKKEGTDIVWRFSPEPAP